MRIIPHDPRSNALTVRPVQNMIALGYLGNELARRWSRTAVTALGLASGVGLVMAIIGVSDGLSQAQNAVLSPLSSVGTDIIVTRTVGATTSGSTTAASPARTSGGQGAANGAGSNGGGFFGSGAGGPNGGSAAALAQLNSADQAALLNANSSILTDLSKLGPSGTKFTHDFFVPGTLITFPDAALQTVAGISGVQSAVPGLSLQAIHESGTVPQISDTYTTGGQTLTTTATPAPLTDAERVQVEACIRAQPRPSPGPGGGGGGFRFDTKCLPTRFQVYNASVVVPTQTITRILNPPATDTTSKTYSVAGVDPASRASGLIIAAQVTSGTWFTGNGDGQLIVNAAYADTNKITVGSTLPINGTNYNVVGIVQPTLTGNISDLYFGLATLQTLSTNTSRVNEILVKVSRSDQVDKVAAAIQAQLPGAQVLTAKSLANQVTGSLADAHTLAAQLGGVLALIILLAAFLIAALLTTSSVSKRTREIGTLRAIGWARGRIVRQIMAETVAIGLIGAAAGVLVGLGVAAAVDHFGPTLASTTTGASVGASTVGALFHQSTTTVASRSIHIQALLTATTVLIGIGCAVLGGLIAGAIGGWRAARLAPAAALRDLG